MRRQPRFTNRVGNELAKSLDRKRPAVSRSNRGNVTARTGIKGVHDLRHSIFFAPDLFCWSVSPMTKSHGRIGERGRPAVLWSTRALVQSFRGLSTGPDKTSHMTRGCLGIGRLRVKPGTFSTGNFDAVAIIVAEFEC
jgi:hypothetical protein